MGYTCRLCKKPILDDETKLNITWVKRNGMFAYHKECWDKFLDIGRERTAEEWYDFIIYDITHILKDDYDYFMTKAQFDNLLKQGMTAKGIYFSFHWFFCIQHNKYEAKYGLGIIPYVYDKATEYWSAEEDKKQGVMNEIIRIQQIEMIESPMVKPMKRKKKQIIEPDF